MYVCVCGAPASGSHTHTHTSSQVSVLLAAEQRGCVTVCSALCWLSSHALAANLALIIINDSRAETYIKFFFLFKYSDRYNQ